MYITPWKAAPKELVFWLVLKGSRGLECWKYSQRAVTLKRSCVTVVTNNNGMKVSDHKM